MEVHATLKYSLATHSLFLLSFNSLANGTALTSTNRLIYLHSMLSGYLIARESSFPKLLRFIRSKLLLIKPQTPCGSSHMINGSSKSLRIYVEPWNHCKTKMQISKTLLVDFKGRTQHHWACTNIHKLADLYYNTKIWIKSKRKTQDRNKVFWQVKVQHLESETNESMTWWWIHGTTWKHKSRKSIENLTKVLSREQVKSLTLCVEE